MWLIGITIMWITISANWIIGKILYQSITSFYHGANLTEWSRDSSESSEMWSRCSMHDVDMNTCSRSRRTLTPSHSPRFSSERSSIIFRKWEPLWKMVYTCIHAQAFNIHRSFSRTEMPINYSAFLNFFAGKLSCAGKFSWGRTSILYCPSLVKRYLRTPRP